LSTSPTTAAVIAESARFSARLWRSEILFVNEYSVHDGNLARRTAETVQSDIGPGSDRLDK
jgi:hypothetical protein